MLININKSQFFSSDRAIAQYNEKSGSCHNNILFKSQNEEPLLWLLISLISILLKSFQNVFTSPTSNPICSAICCSVYFFFMQPVNGKNLLRTLLFSFAYSTFRINSFSRFSSPQIYAPLSPPLDCVACDFALPLQNSFLHLFSLLTGESNFMKISCSSIVMNWNKHKRFSLIHIRIIR